MSYSRGSSRPRNQTWVSCVSRAAGPSERGKTIGCDLWLELLWTAQFLWQSWTQLISAPLLRCCCCCWGASVVSDSVRPRRWQPTRLPRAWDSPGKNTGVGCHFLLQCMKGKSESEVAQSCLTLHDPMDCGPPGSSVHGIFQARVLEWAAVAFSTIPMKVYSDTGFLRFRRTLQFNVVVSFWLFHCIWLKQYAFIMCLVSTVHSVCKVKNVGSIRDVDVWEAYP